MLNVLNSCLKLHETKANVSFLCLLCLDVILARFFINDIFYQHQTSYHREQIVVEWHEKQVSVYGGIDI